MAEGSSATFSAAASAGAALQWQRRAGGSAVWADISGATGASYTTPGTFANDDDAQFRVVASSAGGTSASVAATLDVAPRTWQTKAFVGSADNGAEPHVEFDAAGRAIAVWAGSTSTGDGSFGQVFASRYVDGAWQEPVKLAEYLFTSHAAAARIGVAPDGSAVAVWREDRATESLLWARRFVPGDGWGPATTLSTGIVNRASVDVDADGNALIAWSERPADDQPFDIRTARFTLAGGWEMAALAESQGGNADAPEVAFDGNGNAMLTWQQTDGVRYRAWARRYVAASGWQAATTIDAGVENVSYAVALSVRANGDAFAAWPVTDAAGNPLQVWANRFTVSGGWGTPTRIDDNGGGQGVRIIVDADGRATAMWNAEALFTARYVPGDGWGAAAQLASTAAGMALAIDARGNTLAAWREFDGLTGEQHLRVARRLLGGDWGTPVTLTSVGVDDRLLGSVALRPSGFGLAVWGENYFKSGSDVFAAEFE